MESQAIVNLEEYAALTALDSIRTWMSILVDYVAIISLLGIVILLPHPLIIALSIILIARQQHALAILIHEGVHCRLFPSKRLNDVVVRWLLAGPLFLNYDGYRRAHLDHHRYTMTENDPDLIFIEGFPVSRLRFAVNFVPDFIALTYLFILFHYSKQGFAENRSTGQFLFRILPGLVFNIIMLGSFILAGHGWLYFVCWLLPMFCIFPLFLHLRGMCEHGGHRPDPDPMQCTWTVINAAQTFLVAPHHSNYHMEHHGYPAIPHFNLPALHALLKTSGALPMDNLHFSYQPIIHKLIIAK